MRRKMRAPRFSFRRLSVATHPTGVAQVRRLDLSRRVPRHYTGFVAFRGVDYLLIDSLFSGQELLVRQTARRFVDERVMPVIRDCFRDGRFPRELLPEMAALGFLGAEPGRATVAPA